MNKLIFKYSFNKVLQWEKLGSREMSKNSWNAITVVIFYFVASKDSYCSKFSRYTNVFESILLLFYLANSQYKLYFKGFTLTIKYMLSLQKNVGEVNRIHGCKNKRLFVRSGLHLNLLCVYKQLVSLKEAIYHFRVELSPRFTQITNFNTTLQL